MQALILAAGQGRRMGGELPKPLLQIQGQPLVFRLIEQLRHYGIDDIAVVLGYQMQRLTEMLVPYQIKTIFNPFFATTDNLVSFWFGQSALVEDSLVLHGDLLFDDELLQLVLEASADIVLPYDVHSVDHESMKLQLTGARVVALGKEIPVSEATGESIPLLKFSRAALPLLRQLAEAALIEGRFTDLLESIVGPALNQGTLTGLALDVSGRKWCEIDTPADFQKAKALFGA